MGAIETFSQVVAIAVGFAASAGLAWAVIEFAWKVLHHSLK